MAIDQKMLDLLTKIDNETNAIAARITALQGQIGVGMSQADVDAVNAKLQAESDRLTTLAADPANPVPPPVV